MSFRRSTSNNTIGKRCFSVMSFACVLVAGWFLFIVYLVKFQVLEPTFQTPDPATKSMKDQVAKKRSGTMHVVFSTDCTFFQDWQTMLVFYSAMAVGQKGAITRIASGCDEAKQATLVALYKKLFPKYHVHFTPDFKKDKKSGKKYDFYNKPYGEYTVCLVLGTLLYCLSPLLPLSRFFRISFDPHISLLLLSLTAGRCGALVGSC